MKRKHVLAVLLISLLIFTVVGCGNAQPSSNANSGSSGASTDPGAEGMETDKEATKEKVVLTVAAHVPESNISFGSFTLLQEKVSEATDGQLELKFTGGPEAFPPFELGETVRTGVVDMILSSASYYATNMPESLAVDFSELTTEEEKASGGHDLLNQVHQEKLNAYYLGRGFYSKYSFYTTEEVKSSADFKGLRIRSSSLYVPALKKLGSEPLVIPLPDTYGALEKGIVDGLGYPSLGITDYQFEKLLKYKVYPEFYTGDAVYLVNLDVWNKLPQEYQDVLQELVPQVEQEFGKVLEEHQKAEDEKLRQAGVQFVELQDGENFLKTVHDAGWEWMKENSPDFGEELSEKLSK